MSDRKMTMKDHLEIMKVCLAFFTLFGLVMFATQPTHRDYKNKEIVELAQDATKRLNAGDTVCVTHNDFKGCVTDGVLTVSALTGKDEVWIYRFEQIPLAPDMTYNNKIETGTHWAIKDKLDEAGDGFAVKLREMGALPPRELQQYQSNQLKEIGR